MEINVKLTVYPDVNVPSLCKSVQERIKDSVKNTMEINVALVDGLLNLGTWQQIVLLDFDNKPRSRNITVQLIY